MRTGATLAGFGLALAAVLGGGYAVGDVLGPAEAAEPLDESGHGAHEEAARTEEPPDGLAVAAGGYRLALDAGGLEAARAGELRFRILDADGEALTRYDETHERQLHLVVVSRGLDSFQHVHPRRDADGTWRQRLTLPGPGPYRAYADFAPAGAEPLTLGTDLAVAGEYRPAELPAPSAVDEVDGLTVTLDGAMTPGTESELGFTVERGGEAIDLDPYLGADGHLVALRAGDLAYLHVHPLGAPDAGPGVRFAAAVPSAGTYRLFLDFSTGGVVRTAAFTVEVPDDGDAPATPDDHESEGSDEHEG